MIFIISVERAFPLQEGLNAKHLLAAVGCTEMNEGYVTGCSRTQFWVESQNKA